MQISTTVAKLEEVEGKALVVALYEDAPLPPAILALDARLDGLLARLSADGCLKGSGDAQELVHTMGRLKVERLVLVGAGKASDFDVKRLTDWSVRVAKRLRKAGLSEAVVQLPTVTGASPSQVARAVVEGLELGARDFLKYKSNGGPARELRAVTLRVESSGDETGCKDGIRHGSAIAEGMSFARELSNEPANIATPTFLAERAREMAEAHGIRCQILDPKDMAELKMGALLGVARGSDEPARLIVLELDAAPGAPTIALVGKGLTFDAGGISLKPALKMHEMKFDMCGGAAVLGAMLALSQLRPAVRVVGIVPSTENLPSGKALKPGDVLRSMAGITIEVTNTDAEGRLILADAITYSRRYQPAAVIDVATLTGAIVVALGSHAIGLMGNDEALLDHVKASGFRTGERVWPLPLWREYLDHMKSDVADLNNSSLAGGKAITAAAFLSRFAEGMRWAHLDIAGTAWSDGDGERLVTGATGSGVRTLVESVLSWRA